jgi:hypothetical protein
MRHTTAWRGGGWAVSSTEIGCLGAAGVMRCDLYADYEGCAASAVVGGQPNQRPILFNSFIFGFSLFGSYYDTQWRRYYDHRMLST